MPTRLALALLLLAFAGGGLLARWFAEREHDADLARAAAALGTASARADTLSGRLVVALVSDSARGARVDSLNTVLVGLQGARVRSRGLIPPVPAIAPDTCGPWLDRATALQAALLDAEIVIDTMSSIAVIQESRIAHLRDTIDSAVRVTRQMAADLDLARSRIPLTKPARSRLLAIGEIRLRDGSSDAMLALGSMVLPNTTMYAGIQQSPGGSDRRLVVGARVSVTLR